MKTEKKVMGRPKKTVTKDQVVHVRISTLEYDRLEYYSSTHNKSFSDIIRERLADIIS